MKDISRPSIIYVDLDCVLAHFMDGYERALGRKPHESEDIDWNIVYSTKDFFLNLLPMPDFEILWGHIAPHNPVVLTGVPSRIAEKAEQDKRAWSKKWLGAHIEVICCRSCDKSLYCKTGDILIDDWEKYRDPWLRMGGRWITHKNARDTVLELERLNL